MLRETLLQVVHQPLVRGEHPASPCGASLNQAWALILPQNIHLGPCLSSLPLKLGQPGCLFLDLYRWAGRELPKAFLILPWCLRNSSWACLGLVTSALVACKWYVWQKVCLVLSTVLPKSLVDTEGRIA